MAGYIVDIEIFDSILSRIILGLEQEQKDVAQVLQNRFNLEECQISKLIEFAEKETASSNMEQYLVKKCGKDVSNAKDTIGIFIGAIVLAAAAYIATHPLYKSTGRAIADTVREVKRGGAATTTRRRNFLEKGSWKPHMHQETAYNFICMGLDILKTEPDDLDSEAFKLSLVNIFSKAHEFTSCHPCGRLTKLFNPIFLKMASLIKPIECESQISFKLKCLRTSFVISRFLESYVGALPHASSTLAPTSGP